MRHILRQSVEFETIRDASHTPGFGHRLKHSDQQFASIFFIVVADRWLSDYRQVARKIWNRFGHNIEMLRRMKRHRNSAHLPDFPAPHARTIHNSLASDTALVCDHSCDSTRFFFKGVNASLFEDPNAFIPCAPRQCLGRVGRIGLPVPRQVHRPDQAINGHDGVELLSLSWRDHLDFQTKAAGH